MKKTMIYVAAVLAMSAVAVFNVMTALNANHDYDLTMVSIDALSENVENETGAVIKESAECHDKNGYWNMALICSQSGIQTQTCTIAGEISLFGITAKGSYTKGKIYSIAWERWECKDSPGNCCLSHMQGLRIKG